MSEAGDMDEYFAKLGGDDTDVCEEEGDEELDEWDREANKLYEWTQELNFNDEVMQTPVM